MTLRGRLLCLAPNIIVKGRIHMTCKNCGNEMRDDARFCPHCGTLNGPDQSAGQAAVPAWEGPEDGGKKKKTGLIIAAVAAVAAVAANLLICRVLLPYLYKFSLCCAIFVETEYSVGASRTDQKENSYQLNTIYFYPVQKTVLFWNNAKNIRLFSVRNVNYRSRNVQNVQNIPFHP